MKQYTRVRARVNLDAVEANIDSMKRNLKDGVKMIVVIKADGYGHGGLQIARMLADKACVW